MCVAASVALVVGLALSYVDSALAVTCAANTFEDDTNGSNGCASCPTGTTAAATPIAGTKSYCEGIAIGYYGTKGIVSGSGAKHAVVTSCGTGYSSETDAEFCAHTCGANGYCCNDATVGSNQFLSCAQACMARANGAAESECLTAVHAERACTRSVGGLDFTMCGSCSDVVPSCPNGVQSTAAGAFGCAAASPTTGIEACYKASSATNHFAKQAVSSRYFKCPAGTTAAAAPSGTNANTFCEGIAAGYYGTVGNTNSAHATPTACTTTFSDSGSAAGITSDASTSTTTETACKTAPGYIITSSDGAADGAITVAAAAAGKYAAGGTALLDSDGAGRAAETATDCAAGKYSASGAASCTDCPTGKTSDAGSAFCGKIAAGFYGAAGAASGGAYTSHAGTVTACTTTFSHSSTGSGAITSDESTSGTTDKTACKTKPGYRITTAANVGDANVAIAKAAAGSYIAGGTALPGTGVQTATTCPYGGSTTATGQDAVTDCTPQCGTGTNAEANAGTCRCKANHYGTPKDTNDAELAVVTQGCTACPYDGTSSAGSGAIVSCTPDCNSAYAAAEAIAGTCRCAENYYGTPKDFGDGNDAKPIKGCRCVTNYYVLSNTCTACASGLFRIEGDDPGGGNTACTYASPFASNTQLKDTIASSYCLGGSDATGANCTDGKNVVIANWDVSNVVDMSSLFNGRSGFNQDIGSWNTEMVTDMSGMFQGASAFNQPVGNWATGSVVDMSGMFEGASEFNQDISSWSVGAVVNMESMFSSASSFNQDITGWSSGSLTTSTDMFSFARAWREIFARTDGQNTTHGPPSDWGEPCGNGWYDERVQREQEDDFCEPEVNGIEVKGCADDCKVKTNWKCENVRSLRPGDDFDSYNCTCDNQAGTYASPDLDCARTDCIYGERCLAYGLGCAPGAGGNACDRCLTAADIAELPLNEQSGLSKNGYYKTGQLCTACPATSAAGLFAVAAVVVVLAFCGFKASQLMGPQATNNLKKIVESLQFFSLSLSMSIKWPGPVLNLGKYLEAFTFSMEFLRPECVAAGLDWLNIFLSSVFFVPALIFIIIVVNTRRAKHRYKTMVRAIDSERHEDGETVYWVEKPGFLWGTRRAYESKGGDKIVRELQRQYRFRAALRSFGVLSLTILYLPIVRMCLQSYDCIKIDGVDGLRLEHDIDILCESQRHVIIQAAAAVMLAIVGIGMPIYVIMQVRKIRLSGKLDDPQTIDSYGPFYDVYRREELTLDQKLEIARIRQTAVESSSFRRGEGTSDERPIDAATDDIVEEIANEVRVDTEEDSSDVDRVDVEDDSDARPPQKVASGLGKLARALTMTKSALGRTTSAEARERAHRMHWKDTFALHYLAVELVQKSGIIFTTSPLVAETAVSGWALVFVHWFIGAFVYVCQPWRIMTLSFGKYKVRNCLNRVESFAGFLQGVGPFLAMIFPVQRDALGEVQQTVTLAVISVLLMIIITGLLSIRIIVFAGERVAVKRKKMDIDKDPEKCMQNVHKQLVKFATSRAIVSMFAFKADFDIKRRKARARLEDTRQAMLSRIDILKSQQTDEDYSDKITALYEVANEMAHIVNTIVPQAPPTGPNAEGCIELLDQRLASILKDVDIRAQANALDAPNPAAVHIVMKVHAFDTIIGRLDEHLLEFAAAELVSELAELGRRHAELRHTRSCVAIGFGDAELRTTFSALQSSIETLRHAIEKDDFEAVFTTLNDAKGIIDSHLRWCRDQCEVFTSAEDEHPYFLEDEPPLTTEFFKATVKVIQSHEKQLSKFKSKCIRNWPPLFKNFGRVKYIQGFAEQLQNQLHLDLNEGTPEEAKAVFDQVLAFTDGFALWCGDLVTQVEGSEIFIVFEPIARAMVESLKAIRADAESQSALVRQALSMIDYAVTQRALAATTRSGLQTALADGTSALEGQLAAEIAHMDAAKIFREITFETEKMRIEEALNALEQESDGRRAVLEDDIRSQHDTIARLRNLKRKEAAASSSINPLKWERFRRSTELAEAVSALHMSKQNLKNEELANEKARGDARKAVHSLERGLKKDLVECDVRAKKIRDRVAKELKKQTLDAQRETPEDAKAHKASLASRRAVFQQQRAAAKLIASETREAARIQAQLAGYMRKLKAPES